MSNAPVITLILLPGMDGTGDLFVPFIQALNPNIQTIVVSYPNSVIMSYEELSVLVSEFIPIDRPYMLLAESFSGPIAISLAANASYQLKGLILSSTFAKNPRPKLSKLSFLLPTLPINKTSFLLLHKLLMAGFSNKNISQCLFDAVSMVSPKTMRARLDAVIHVDKSSALASINVPILYLQGRYDYLVPAAAAQFIFKAAKNVALVELEAPHLLLQIAPKQAAEKVQAFIENAFKYQA